MRNKLRRSRNKNTLNLFNKVLAPLLALSTLITSCLGDKTTQDYLQDQANQQAAQLQSIQGTYNGLAVSSIDHSVLGGVSLKLHVDYNQLNQASANSVIEQAVLSGSITFNGAVLPPGAASVNNSQINPTLTFSNGSYDPSSKHFTANFPVEAGAANQLSIEGYVNGSSITGGKLNASGQDGYGVEFILEENGSLPSEAALAKASGSSLRLNAMNSQFQVFSGPVSNSNHLQFILSMNSTSGNDSEKLWDLLSPTRQVMAEVWLYATDSAVTNQFTFQKATMDDGTEGHSMGSLNSTSAAIDAAGNINSEQLHCDAKRAGGQATVITGWNCSLIGSGAVVTEASLVPGALPAGIFKSSDLSPLNPVKN